MSKHRFFAVSLFAALLLAVPALAQDAPAEPAAAQQQPQKKSTLNKIVAIRNLRCDALLRAKTATMQANIFSSEASHARGSSKVTAEKSKNAHEGAAGAAYEEAGNLKRRMEKLANEYVEALRLKWYQTEDIAQKIRIERKIEASLEIVAEGC